MPRSLSMLLGFHLRPRTSRTVDEQAPSTSASTSNEVVVLRAAFSSFPFGGGLLLGLQQVIQPNHNRSGRTWSVHRCRENCVKERVVHLLLAEMPDWSVVTTGRDG